MRAMKDAVKQVLRSAGFELKRIEELPKPPRVYDDLHEACRRKNYGELAAFLCPIAKLITVNGFSFLHRKSWHPFVETLQEFIASGGRQTYSGSSLEQFYQSWQPRHSLEALIGAIGPASLTHYPPWAMHSPWLDINPDKRRAYMQHMMKDENRWGGLERTDGYGLHGPVSFQSGEAEYRRLLRTLNSIRRHGYDRRISRNDVTVVALEHEGRYRFCIIRGQHRIPVLAVLGYQAVPVSITRVMHSSEVAHWPQVYRKQWTAQEALAYIEHLFTFDARSWAESRGLIKREEASSSQSFPGSEDMETPPRLF